MLHYLYIIIIFCFLIKIYETFTRYIRLMLEIRTYIGTYISSKLFSSEIVRHSTHKFNLKQKHSFDDVCIISPLFVTDDKFHYTKFTNFGHFGLQHWLVKCLLNISQTTIFLTNFLKNRLYHYFHLLE